jgi:sodium transport system ATP-binding protein
MIELQQVSKRFGGTLAVDSLTVAAQDASITGLLGANGAGKSTTLRMIAGVLRPDSGTIRIGGRELGADRAAAQRDLGALLDHTGLYERLTPREHLQYFARLRGVSRGTAERRIGRLLDELELGRVADRPVAAFSQGERMKVALGRVLVHEPKHLLLDEPTNGLDVPTVRSLRRLLQRLRDTGTCIVYSSHVLGEVETLCDRIAVVAGGVVVGQGTADSLCEAASADSLENAFIHLTKTSEKL